MVDTAAAESIAAFEGAINIALGGDFAIGKTWVVELNGVRIRQTATPADTALTDIATKLAASIDQNLSVFYDADATGSVITVTRTDGASYVASVTLEDGTGAIVSGGSIPTSASSSRYASAVLVVGGPGGALTKGDAYTLTLNRSIDPDAPASTDPNRDSVFRFTAGSRFNALDLIDVTAGLAAAINDDASNGLTAIPDGRTITIDSASPIQVGTLTPAFGTITIAGANTTQVTLTLAGGALVSEGQVWELDLNSSSYRFIAPAIVSATRPNAVDVRIADDEAPEVLILETGETTRVVEPSNSVVLGTGSVTGILSSSSFITLLAPRPVSGAEIFSSIRVNTPKILVVGDPSPAEFLTARLILLADPTDGEEFAVTIDPDGDGTRAAVTFIYTAHNVDTVATVLGELFSLITDASTGVFDVKGAGGADPVMGLAAKTTGTRFAGDFGNAVIEEANFNDSAGSAQNLDLAKFSDAANPNIGRATDLAHLLWMAGRACQAGIFC